MVTINVSFKENGMPIISDRTAELLQNLGVLDSLLQITPEAYVGAIARKPVDKQAELLDIPVIIRPFRKNGGSPENQFITYFKSRVSMSIDGGESYSTEGFIIKHLLSFLIPEFDYRKKKHNYTDNETERQTEHLINLKDKDILQACENFLDPNDMEFIYDSINDDEQIISTSFLSDRFDTAKVKITSQWIDDRPDADRIALVKNKDRKNNYIRYNLEQIDLWNSLKPDEWLKLANIVLKNWEKMYAGWPDLTFFSKEHGIILIEIKGSDRIHASQVFTLLKLKEVLTEKRMAIGWLNSGKINFSGRFYTSHMNEVLEWFNSPWKERSRFVQKIRKL